MRIFPSHYLPVLKNKDFVKLWISHILSQISSYALLFIIISRTFDLTTSTIATGMVWISFTLPIVFLSPFSGSLVDIWSKRKTLITTYLIHFFITSLFAISFLFKKDQLVHPLIFLFSLTAVINDPAEMAELPQIVKKKQELMSANGILFFTDQAALILSSVVGGVLLKFIPLTAVISLMALMPLGASFAVSFLPKKEKEGRRLKSINKEIEDLLVRVKSGYQFISQNRLILYGISLIILFRVFVTLSILLLPSLAKNILAMSVYDAGYAIVLPVVLGLILGTAILNRSRKIRKKEWIGLGLVSLGINFILFLILKPRIPLIRRLVEVFFSVAIGVSASIIYAPAQTFIHEFTPAHLRGHTFSSLIFWTTIISIPATLVVTSLADVLGIKTFLVIIGVLISLFGLLIIKKGNEIILATNNRS